MSAIHDAPHGETVNTPLPVSSGAAKTAATLTAVFFTAMSSSVLPQIRPLAMCSPEADRLLLGEPLILESAPDAKSFFNEDTSLFQALLVVI